VSQPITRTLTLARVQAIEIAIHWRWVGVLLCCTWLLAVNVLPARFPLWEVSTSWLTSLAVVLTGELALLLHELSHALVAHRRGKRVLRIVFHGLHAETVLTPSDDASPSHDASVALVGPGVNLVLALVIAGLRFVLHTDGPLDVVLLLQVVSNLAMAAMSLLPIGGSDGARALCALRSSGSR
jgi:Zn-dependent protease